MRLLRIGLVCLLAMGCSRGAKAPALPPTTAPEAGPVAEPRAEPTPFEQVPPPPASCAPYVAAPKDAGSTCPSGRDAALEALDGALSHADAAAVDRGLAVLEGCPAYEPGLLLALRADLAPAECADALVESFASAGASLRKGVRDAHVGLALGARLSRLVREPPALPGSVDKAGFEIFFRERLTPWIFGQAKAIHGLSTEGARLSGYGRAIAAVEAGLADMRFVDVVRGVTLPEEMARDPELSDVYYASLDEALEPRKSRGRDAALVGLREFEKLGVLRDPRVDRARTLLSRLYGGRRIDALDGLLLPELPALGPVNVEERLAAKLPPFYAEYVLSGWAPREASALRSLENRGISPALRARLLSTSLPADSARLFARVLFRLGQLYWRSQNFVEAESVSRALSGAQEAEARLIAALSVTLARGPKDAAEMMLRGPQYPAGVGNVEALDAIARSGAATAALAEFDAALILRLVPPLQGDAAYWDDLAARFRRAQKRLTHESHRRAAADAARAAEETAKAIREGRPTPTAP